MALSQGWKLICNGFKIVWERMTTLIILNLLWFLLWLAPMFINSVTSDNQVYFWICVVVSLILFGPVTAAMHHLINRIVHGDVIGVSDFIAAFKQFFWRSEALTWLSLFIIVILLVGFAFISSHSLPVIRIFSALWLYAILFWLMVYQFVFPCLIQQKLGVWTTLKQATLLVKDNMLVSLMLLLLSGLLTIMGWYVIFIFVVFWFSVISLLQNYIMVELLKEPGNGHSKE